TANVQSSIPSASAGTPYPFIHGRLARGSSCRALGTRSLMRNPPGHSTRHGSGLHNSPSIGQETGHLLSYFLGTMLDDGRADVVSEEGQCAWTGCSRSCCSKSTGA